MIQNTNSQQIYEEKLNRSYYYCLAEQTQFFETHSDKIDANWLSREKIGATYQLVIRDYLMAKMNSLQISRKDLLSITCINDAY